MNAEIIIKNFESDLRSHFTVKGDFRAVFRYSKHRKNVVTFDIVDDKKRVLDKNKVFAIVGSPREICWYHGKHFWKLVNLYSTLRGYSIDEFDEHDTGILIADCLNYYYRLYATIPPSLYYVH